MTLSDLTRISIKVTTFFEVEYREKLRVLDIAQEEKYLTYGMVLCLVTLTDL